jgi:hypothetical protein
MPIVAQIVCDNCHTVKKATNHWYVISFENNTFCLKPLALALPADWATKHVPDSSLQYFCGRLCAVEALTGWLTKLHKDETEVCPTNAKDASIGRSFFEVSSNEGSFLTDQSFRNRSHLENPKMVSK